LAVGGEWLRDQQRPTHIAMPLLWERYGRLRDDAEFRILGTWENGTTAKLQTVTVNRKANYDASGSQHLEGILARTLCCDSEGVLKHAEALGPHLWAIRPGSVFLLRDDTEDASRLLVAQDCHQ